MAEVIAPKTRNGLDALISSTRRVEMVDESFWDRPDIFMLLMWPIMADVMPGSGSGVNDVEGSRELTDSFLGHFQPSYSVFLSLWRYEYCGGQCKSRDDDGTSGRVADMVAEEPCSNGDLYNICPEFIDLPHGPYNNFDLYHG